MTNQSGATANGTAGGVLGGSYPNPTFATNGTTPLLGILFTQLTANVAMTLANTDYDAVTLALSPGTWVLIASLKLVGAAGTPNILVRLWDGTTTYATAEQTAFGVGFIQYPLVTVVTPAAPTTYRLSARSGAVGSAIYAAGSQGATGNNATSLLALRVA